MKIRINRDSVCAGDDASSHAKSIDVSDSITLDEFLAIQRSSYPLAKIAGDKATWILKGNRILAVLAQQWEEPKFLVLRDTLISEVIDRDAKYTGELHFLYWVQDDPDLVFDEILHTRTLPAKRGGYSLKPEK